MDRRDWYLLLRAAASREEAQTMAEYGVVLALITLAVIGALGLLAAGIATRLGAITSLLTSIVP